MNDIIDLNIKKKIFYNNNLSILNDFKLEVEEAEKISIVGKSGVGKSSLLNILGLLDRNYIGEYALFGMNLSTMNEKEMAKWRNEKIGFVLQESALINSLTIEENIKLPLLYAESKKNEEILENFKNITKEIDIESILKKKPLECSGGERARASFARGILMKPQIILADEPTASLDTQNKEKIIKLLFKINKKFNTTIITVTHDLEVAKCHDRIIHLRRE
ncbi:MAG: ABC transporter ATP-binding protein [Blautia producta]|uniref:ABC transporter ATP-binding protein n=1 Tax=Blautia producta TaxID=33035 RepID=UPI00290ED9A0|nr:ABC transporter ATP-binding protein [Blautia producta]MDU6882158.1 ABC transporter ATP-binding protein [Blautia producta]